MKYIKQLLEKFIHHTLMGQIKCPKCGEWAKFHQYLNEDEEVYYCPHCNRFIDVVRD